MASTIELNLQNRGLLPQSTCTPDYREWLQKNELNWQQTEVLIVDKLAYSIGNFPYPLSITLQWKHLFQEVFPIPIFGCHPPKYPA